MTLAFNPKINRKPLQFKTNEPISLKPKALSVVKLLDRNHFGNMITVTLTFDSKTKRAHLLVIYSQS